MNVSRVLRGVPTQKPIEFPVQPIQARHHFLILRFFDWRKLAADVEYAAGLQDALIHLLQPGETLAVQHGDELRARQHFAGKRPLHNLALVDQDRGLAFEDSIKPTVLEKKAHY